MDGASRPGSLNSEDVPVENTEPVTFPDTPALETRSASTVRTCTESNNCAASESGTQTVALTHQVTSL